MKPLIEIRGLRVRRSGQLALNVPALRVMRGETLAVMGPNGAGKSTLLLAIAGLLPESFGSVFFDGETFTRRNALTLRRRMALVLQSPLLLDTSVYANVASGLRFRHLPRQVVRQQTLRWMERLGIAHLADRRASHLSGGEAQRVSLARAFALQPELLLLDEPFSSLDPEPRARLLTDLRELLDESGITALLVTHYAEEAHLLTARRLALQRGRIVSISHSD